MFKKVIHQIDSKNDCSFQLVLLQNLSLNTGKRIFFLGLILKLTKRAQALLKSSNRDFQNSAPFERSACFYVTSSGNFVSFQYFNFETNFQENKTLFQITESNVFQLKVLRLEKNHFHINLSCQKPILRQIEW